MQVFYIFLKLSCYYYPYVFKLKMLLPLHYLQKDHIYLYLPYITAKIALTKKGQVYKNIIQNVLCDAKALQLIIV